MDLEYKNGIFHIAGVSERSVTLGELASLAAPGWPRPNIRRSEALQDGLSATAYLKRLEIPVRFPCTKRSDGEPGDR